VPIVTPTSVYTQLTYMSVAVLHYCALCCCLFLPIYLSLLLLTRRMSLPPCSFDNLNVKFFSASLANRFRAEVLLSKLATESDTVLCFGNLPPIFRLKSPVVLYLQNRLLVDEISLPEFFF